MLTIPNIFYQWSEPSFQQNCIMKWVRFQGIFFPTVLRAASLFWYFFWSTWIFFFMLELMKRGGVWYLPLLLPNQKNALGSLSDWSCQVKVFCGGQVGWDTVGSVFFWAGGLCHVEVQWSAFCFFSIWFFFSLPLFGRTVSDLYNSNLSALRDWNSLFRIFRCLRQESHFVCTHLFLLWFPPDHLIEPRATDALLPQDVIKFFFSPNHIFWGCHTLNQFKCVQLVLCCFPLYPRISCATFWVSLVTYQPLNFTFSFRFRNLRPRVTTMIQSRSLVPHALCHYNLFFRHWTRK